MARSIKVWALLWLPFLLAHAPVAANAQRANVSLSASRGFIFQNTPGVEDNLDWLVGQNPLFVIPGQPGGSDITIDPTYRDANNNELKYTGRLKLSASCCFSPDLKAWLNPGITISLGQERPTFLRWGEDIPDWLRERLGAQLLLSSTFVDIAGQPTSVTLTATAGPTPNLVVGNFKLFITAEGPRGVATGLGLTISVLPPWPPDGPAPTCAPPGLETLPLSQLAPYSWKAKEPMRTRWPVGVASKSSPIGMQFTIREEKRTPPLAPNQAIIRFTNTGGGPVAIRRADSRNCANLGLPLVAEAGGAPATFAISTADTTTLVFTRPVCGNFFIVCWGQRSMEDVLQFSEGPFWLLFGGRAVDIETVGGWDRAVNPLWGRADVVITTP